MDRDEHASTATQADHGLTRRGVMRKTAIGVGAAATMGGGAMTLENGPVQESRALAPLIAGGFLAGVAIDWTLRKYDVYGGSAPAEGLTASALKQNVYQTALTRESTNGTTFLNNQNLLGGVENNAYTEAKVAAIEQLNAGATETEVLAAANDAIDGYETTVYKNFLKTWNEAVNEAGMLASAISSHSNVSASGVFEVGYDHASSISYSGFQSEYTETVSFPDGSEMVINSVTGSSFDGVPTGWGGAPDSGKMWVRAQNGNGDSVRYMEISKWQSLNNEITSAFQTVRDGISTWVTNVYGSVQSGEVEITDLLTPREQAAMMTEDGKYPQAVADLIALNIPVDLEREATVTIPSTGTTLRGTFALTDSADGPLSSGETYDPSTFAGDAYLTTDISLLEGTWSAYQTAVDGGVITLTEEPYEGVVYEVETTAGEIASVAATDWTDSGGTWTYDASADLETPITEVSAVSFYAETTETQYETIQLDSQFTIEKFMNTETGEEETSAMFTSSEPQDDTNYITQEEWDSLEQQNQELIEKYEESQNSGGGGGGLLGNGLFSDTKTLGVVAGGAALAALLFGNN